MRGAKALERLRSLARKVPRTDILARLKVKGGVALPDQVTLMLIKLP